MVTTLTHLSPERSILLRSGPLATKVTFSTPEMALSPTDQSKQFIESGMRLITSPSSDTLMKKASEKYAAARKAASNFYDTDDPNAS